MMIGSEKEYIQIEELGRNPAGTPCAGDINLRVMLKLQGFSGSHDGIWVEHSEIERFISELGTLDKKREGSAKILSMSPQEFTLEIRSSDKLGHIEIEVQLHRHQYSGPKCWPVYLKGGFEVQPETIRQLMSCFNTFTS